MKRVHWVSVVFCCVTMVLACKKDNGGGTTSGVTPDISRFPVTVSIPSGTGKVTSTPAGISCPSGCEALFPMGSTITLTAIGNGATTLFSGWGGDCAGSGPCTVVISSTKSISAVFTPPSAGLFVTKTGSGSGTVTSTPTGINCGVDCSETFAFGTLVTLTANPSGLSDFVGWSGACTGTGPCTVTMGGAKNVAANFGPASLDGTWEGLADFNVTGVTVSSFSVSGTLFGRFCSVSYTVTHLGSNPVSNWKFSYDGFSFDYSGEFISKTLALGKSSYTDDYCEGTDSKSWSSSKTAIPGSFKTMDFPEESMETVVIGDVVIKRKINSTTRH